MAMGATSTQRRTLFLGQILAIIVDGVIPGAALALGASFLTRNLR